MCLCVHAHTHTHTHTRTHVRARTHTCTHVFYNTRLQKLVQLQQAPPDEVQVRARAKRVKRALLALGGRPAWTKVEKFEVFSVLVCMCGCSMLCALALARANSLAKTRTEHTARCMLCALCSIHLLMLAQTRSRALFGFLSLARSRSCLVSRLLDGSISPPCMRACTHLSVYLHAHSPLYATHTAQPSHANAPSSTHPHSSLSN